MHHTNLNSSSRGGLHPALRTTVVCRFRLLGALFYPTLLKAPFALSESYTIR